MIRIIDCGSQLTQNIARRVRELGVYADIVPFKTSLEAVLAGNPDALIVSGGPHSVYDPKAPQPDQRVFEQELPVLGICYGQQLMAQMLGGLVKPADKREYGRMTIRVAPGATLFESSTGDAERLVWMSHGDVVDTLPAGFRVVATSANGHAAAIENTARRKYGVQFHPEVDHTVGGRELLKRFVDISNAKKDWTMDDFIASEMTRIRDTVGESTVIGGVSGGVDSTTAAVLLHNALGDKFHPIFVNNGVLRKNEEHEVQSALHAAGITNLRYVDASNRFLTKLLGVSDPDQKRKIIGNEFIDVFDDAARPLGASYLLQGTLYPDVIESVPVYGTSSKIKRHHNVGGLPDRMHLKLIEPFRNLFKDEVRQIAYKLGMPKELVGRHPFPGPGLAVRIIGDITPQKVKLLQDADAIYMDELRKANLYDRISQAGVILTNTNSVGVQGDAHSYQTVAALRAVVTNDFMTAHVYPFDVQHLENIATRIINEVKGINRVVYDVTSKPPGTIEWE